MNRLMQVTGLDYNSLVEITALLLQVISFSVFIGILMYDLFNSFCAFIGRSIRSIHAFILKRGWFPHGKKSRP